jgi:CheY-like chemotaxis protein
VKLLLVEDNPDLCRSMDTLLSLLGHEVRFCERSVDALALLPDLGPLDLLITDYYLPDINGVELIRHTRRSRPGLHAILLTGSPEEGIVKAVRAVPRCTLLRKPVDLERLEKELADVEAVQAASFTSASASSRMSSGQ